MLNFNRRQPLEMIAKTIRLVPLRLVCSHSQS
jgi:hypothetical protein